MGSCSSDTIPSSGGVVSEMLIDKARGEEVELLAFCVTRLDDDDDDDDDDVVVVVVMDDEELVTVAAFLLVVVVASAI